MQQRRRYTNGINVGLGPGIYFAQSIPKRCGQVRGLRIFDVCHGPIPGKALHMLGNSVMEDEAPYEIYYRKATKNRYCAKSILSALAQPEAHFQ
ncbi:protein of unknown function [Georgfuchsia toluolica]|uniref:Uncharacterized protein n=2 Tax=Georgfuchsia toluolica TaxID=424218 RepID=A0A916N0E7_9PROT|nr:protein of unknown function [Georgfuchsia toluolica]